MGRSLITSLLATKCEIQQGRNSCPRLQFLVFSLDSYHVPLSFIRSISLASLFTSLSIFGWSDLLQILRKPAALSFAVLYIIVFRLFGKQAAHPTNVFWGLTPLLRGGFIEPMWGESLQIIKYNCNAITVPYLYSWTPQRKGFQMKNPLFLH